MTYHTVAEKLEQRRVIILDGGTGTDIQRCGVPMSGETWCADANATHPDAVRSVHEDYVAAGADVITTNTFASSPLRFNYLNRDDDVLMLDAAAVREAKAAASPGVAVAGSVSTMRPVYPGGDRTILDFDWPPAKAKDLYRRKVSNLKSNGVDLIFMEMMRDTDYSMIATEAALESGLPVWIGLSVERRADGELSGFGREDQLLRDFAPAFAALRPQAICIMHTSPNDTGAAIDILKQHWSGPIGAYPESGYFKSPDWQFVDVISPQDLVRETKVWHAQGASIFGGCCGLGCEHIKALSKEFKS
jgi:S-methylmethionine-dependent homocysteine/selenocysteine methylase